MRYAIKAVVFLCVALLVNGCATMADSIEAKGTGQYRVYDNDFDTVWDAVIDVVKTSKLELVSEDKGRGQILAQRGMSALSYGENVAIFVEKEDGEIRTRVEVVSKKALATTVLAKNWEEHILEELDSRLN